MELLKKSYVSVLNEILDLIDKEDYTEAKELFYFAKINPKNLVLFAIESGKEQLVYEFLKDVLKLEKEATLLLPFIK